VTAETAQQALASLDDDFSPIDDLRATAWYRTTVSQNLLQQALNEAIDAASEAAA
jgi:xanthine dehydrogenase iron-sulfur cluster and FAD-binding subunit A